MFSATWPREVRELADEFQHAPVRIHVGSTDKLVASENITQHVTVVESPREKLDRLIELVMEQQAAATQAAEDEHGAHEAGEAAAAAAAAAATTGARGRRKAAMAAAAAPRGRGRSRSSACHTVVFVNRKKEIDSIARKLSQAARGADGADGGDRYDRYDRSEPSLRVVALHGDMQQPARDRNLDLVKSGRAQARRACTSRVARRASHIAHCAPHRTPTPMHAPHVPPATDEEPSPK